MSTTEGPWSATDGVAQGQPVPEPGADGVGLSPAPDGLTGRGRPIWSRALRRATEANAVVVTILAVVLGLVFGAALIMVTDSTCLNAWGRFFGSPWHAISVNVSRVANAYGALFTGSIFSPSALGHTISTGSGWDNLFYPMSETLVAATPLILSGLGVALGFSTGVFNIGGQGQFIMGALGATYAGFAIHLPIYLHLPLVVLAGAAGGAVAGFIPGILKAATGAHEVIVTIMLNYTFSYLLNYLLSQAPLQQPGQTNSISRTIPTSGRLPPFFGGGLRVNAGLLIALAMVLIMAWFVKKSTLGFEFKVIGTNPWAGRTAGMNAAKATVLALTLSGLLVGMAGMASVAGTDFFLSTGYGGESAFNAITVALVGRNRPGGVALASLLFAAITAGGRYMETSANIPLDLTLVIQAVIVFMVATPALVREIFRLRDVGTGKIVLFAKGWGG